MTEAGGQGIDPGEGGQPFMGFVTGHEAGARAAGGEECSGPSETEMGMLGEEAVQARVGSVKSPPLPSLLSPRTRRGLKREEQ